MSGVATAVVGGAVLYNQSEQRKSASQAADAQANAAQAGMSEQRQQFEKLIELMAPYVAAGKGSLTQMQDIIGINGPVGQQKAIDAVQTSPVFQGLITQGENAMRQNAAATGGLRGGNFQAALSNFRPTLLNQLLDQQYARLGGLTSLGQNAAAMQGNAGMQTGANIANLWGDVGAADAGRYIAHGANNLGTATLQTMGAMKGMGYKFF